MVKKIIGRAALKAAKAALKKGKASDGKRTQVLKRVRAAAQLDEAPMSAKQVQQKERNFTLNFKNIKAHRNKYSDAELRQLINKIDDSRPNVKRAEYRQALREYKPKPKPTAKPKPTSPIAAINALVNGPTSVICCCSDLNCLNFFIF